MRSAIASLLILVSAGMANMLAAPSTSAASTAAPTNAGGHSLSRPNFVVILADDLGYGDTSPYGGWIPTPHLDRLAKEGLRFTDFHSSGNVCSPTRAGLLTGRYQQRAGIPGVVYASPKNPAYFSGLQAVEQTLPERLKQAGYTTALFGKWHLGYFPPYNPRRHGFDEFRGYVSGNVDYHSHCDNQGRADWWNGERLEDEKGYSTHLITRHAVDFLKRPHDRPFLLYVAHEAVHDPYQGPQDPPQRGGTGPADAAQKSKKRAADRTVRDAYRAMMTELDKGVGAVIETLRATGLADNTLVFFFSDNGANANGSNSPLRGHKGSDWEGGHRVPAIAWWPGKIRPGVTDQLAISIDLMPTFLDIAGTQPAPDRPPDGTSLRPLLLDGQPLGARRLFWNGVAMRDGTWKLMLQKGQSHLFDLSKDIGETQDLASAHPERVREMTAALKRWQQDVTTDATPQPTSAEGIR